MEDGTPAPYKNKYDDDEKTTHKRRIILYLHSTGNGSDDAVATVDATRADSTRTDKMQSSIWTISL
jgi:hypothetical protein